MKSVVFLFLILAILLAQPFADASEEWKTAKSTHFIIYYKNAPESFIEKLINKSENYYDQIAEALGFRRFNFWLWDNRAKIYIYDNADDYQSATGQPSWSGGVAMPKEKIINTFPYAKGFFDGILAHEMSHIIFREFVGFDNYAVPVWLDEGVAAYQEKGKYSMADSLVKEAINNNSFIPLDKLTGLNPQGILDQAEVKVFYSEAVSIVDYLIREFGKENFVVFCQDLRDKMNLEIAVKSVYPFSNIGELQEAWKKHLSR